MLLYSFYLCLGQTYQQQPFTHERHNYIWHCTETITSKVYWGLSFVSSADTMCSHKEFILGERSFMHIMQSKGPRNALGGMHVLMYPS